MGTNSQPEDESDLRWLQELAYSKVACCPALRMVHLREFNLTRGGGTIWGKKQYYGVLL
jgi:hypothetical protein